MKEPEKQSHFIEGVSGLMRVLEERDMEFEQAGPEISADGYELQRGFGLIRFIDEIPGDMICAGWYRRPMIFCNPRPGRNPFLFCWITAALYTEMSMRIRRN